MHKLTRVLFKFYFALFFAVVGLQIILTTLEKALPVIAEYAVVAFIIAAVVTAIVRRPRHPKRPLLPLNGPGLGANRQWIRGKHHHDSLAEELERGSRRHKLLSARYMS